MANNNIPDEAFDWYDEYAHGGIHRTNQMLLVECDLFVLNSYLFPSLFATLSMASIII